MFNGMLNGIFRDVKSCWVCPVKKQDFYTLSDFMLFHGFNKWFCLYLVVYVVTRVYS